MKLPVTMKDLQIRGTDGVMVCDLRNNEKGEEHGKIIVALLNGTEVKEEVKEEPKVKTKKKK